MGCSFRLSLLAVALGLSAMTPVQAQQMLEPVDVVHQMGSQVSGAPVSVGNPMGQTGGMAPDLLSNLGGIAGLAQMQGLAAGGLGSMDIGQMLGMTIGNAVGTQLNSQILGTIVGSVSGQLLDQALGDLGLGGIQGGMMGGGNFGGLGSMLGGGMGGLGMGNMGMGMGNNMLMSGLLGGIQGGMALNNEQLGNLLLGTAVQVGANELGNALGDALSGGGIQDSQESGGDQIGGDNRNNANTNNSSTNKPQKVDTGSVGYQLGTVTAQNGNPVNDAYVNSASYMAGYVKGLGGTPDTGSAAYKAGLADGKARDGLDSAYTGTDVNYLAGYTAGLQQKTVASK